MENASAKIGGIQKQILLTAACITTCEQDTAMKLPNLVGHLCKILMVKEVANNLAANVRAGETVALVDRRAGYAFRLQVQTRSIHVLGICRCVNRPADTGRVFYLLPNLRLLYESAKEAA